MPQEFHVLRCFACEIFQVHQTKKDKKWTCKVCGEKQSLKKAYFRGSARDCRSAVQTLNLENGENKSRKENHQLEEFNVGNELSDSSNFEPLIKESENQEECPEFSDCPHPFKKQRKNAYMTSTPNEEIEKLSSDQNHLIEPQILPEQGILASSDINFDFKDFSPVENVNDQGNQMEKNFAEKPKVPKNRGLQMILKAAQNKSRT